MINYIWTNITLDHPLHSTWRYRADDVLRGEKVEQ